MKGGISLLSVLGSLGLLAVSGIGTLAVLGTAPLVVRGAVAGLALGWFGSALELRLMMPHLQSDFPRALRVLTAGFAVRLAAILAGVLLLEDAGLADGSAFGVSVVTGFLSFLPVLAAAARSPVGNGEARG